MNENVSLVCLVVWLGGGGGGGVREEEGEGRGEGLFYVCILE